MTAWKQIPHNLDIPHNDCVIIRRPDNRGGWFIAISYKSISNGWRVENGAFGIEGFVEWVEIPE